MDTVFPRLERARSNFIVLPRGGLYEVRVVIRGAFCQGHASMCIQPVLSNWPALFFQPALGMRAEVLCPMLTSQLFTMGPVSPFAYKQLQLNQQTEKKESKEPLLGTE